MGPADSSRIALGARGSTRGSDLTRLRQLIVRRVSPANHTRRSTHDYCSRASCRRVHYALVSLQHALYATCFSAR
jgi:hypothetical protein